jgi:hypothetical protein
MILVAQGIDGSLPSEIPIVYVKRCLIGRQLALAAAGLVLLGGCGGGPADQSNLPGGIAADLWSAADGTGVGFDEPVDDPNLADVTDDDTSGHFFSVVSGAQATRIYVDAGKDQGAGMGAIVHLGGAVVLTGVELDLAYHWEQSSGPAVTLNDPGLLRPSFVAPTVDTDTVLQFTLVVSAGEGSGSDSVNVTVLGTDLLVAYAKDWGFDPADSTWAIQSAIDSGARTVIIENVGADWVVEPLTLVSNQLIHFEPGVVVVAKNGAFHGANDCLFSGIGLQNVSLYGYGATLRMRKEDYAGTGYSASAARHGVYFENCANVTILGLRCEKSGGDGICFSERWTEYGEDALVQSVEIADCVFDDNYGQSIRIGGVDLLQITDAALSDTPADFGVGVLVQVVVSNCISQNTVGRGFAVDFKDTPAGPLVGVLFASCPAVDGEHSGD